MIKIILLIKIRFVIVSEYKNLNCKNAIKKTEPLPTLLYFNHMLNLKSSISNIDILLPYNKGQ